MSEPSADLLPAPPERLPLLILAVASGKGGVGKTMLTVACAYELSLGGPTLVIDLDFFNRGLSGLFRGQADVGLIARPRFLDAIDGPPSAPWKIVEVDYQLYHIAYPDLVPDELVRLENRSAEDVALELRDFIWRAVELCGARSVVLDCHGGPDRTSFAAALLADYTLLISEPDRITLHGTLNFLRQLRRGAEPAPTGVRFVFNKVVPAFRPAFLRRFYNQSLRESFGGSDLLAMFPLELRLTKAFEDTPLISRVYPYSFLARKMRVLLLDLLADRSKGHLAPSALILPRWTRRYRRRTLGRIPWFLNLERILQIIAVTALIVGLGAALKPRILERPKTALFRAAILAELARHPEITVTESNETYRLIKNPAILGSSYQYLSPSVVEDFRSKDRDTADSALRKALTADGRSLFIAGANPAQDWSVSRGYGDDIPIGNALSYFREHVANLPAPRGFEKEWQADVKTLQATDVQNLKKVEAITDAVELALPATVILFIWLCIALYIDWHGRLDTAFVRLLHSSYLLAFAVISGWIGLLALPVLIAYASNRSISEPEPVKLSAILLPFLVVGLPYFFILAQQIYLSYRLCRDGARDYQYRNPGQRDELPSSTRRLPFARELSLRLFFILALVGILVLLAVYIATSF
jgi:MinD-like ATPase involved in chromosome partitioning or flagellar assembly